MIIKGKKVGAVLGVVLGIGCLGGESFAATATGRQLLRRMDIDRSGSVSRQEFSQYLGRRGVSRAAANRLFNRLDTNKNGSLSGNELSVPNPDRDFYGVNVLHGPL